MENRRETCRKKTLARFRPSYFFWTAMADSAEPVATTAHVGFCFKTLTHHFKGGSGHAPTPDFEEAHW